MRNLKRHLKINQKETKNIHNLKKKIKAFKTRSLDCGHLMLRRDKGKTTLLKHCKFIYSQTRVKYLERIF